VLITALLILKNALMSWSNNCPPTNWTKC